MSIHFLFFKSFLSDAIMRLFFRLRNFFAIFLFTNPSMLPDFWLCHSQAGYLILGLLCAFNTDWWWNNWHGWHNQSHCRCLVFAHVHNHRWSWKCWFYKYGNSRCWQTKVTHTSFCSHPFLIFIIISAYFVKMKNESIHSSFAHFYFAIDLFLKPLIKMDSFSFFS